MPGQDWIRGFDEALNVMVLTMFYKGKKMRVTLGIERD